MLAPKKAFRIIGLSLLFVVLVTSLLAAAVFVYSHVESQNYKRDITVQMKEFSDNGKSGDVATLKNVPFGDLINPEYRKLKDLESSYKDIYANLINYYAEKDAYEARTTAYNDARQQGKDPGNGDELARQYDELQVTMNQLNQKIDNLKTEFSNS